MTSYIDSGNQMAVEGIYRGTHSGPLMTPQGEVPATGRKLALPLCDVIEVAAGRITAIRAYYDPSAIAQQLGLVPQGAPATA